MHVPHAADSAPRRVICRAERGLVAVMAEPGDVLSRRSYPS